MDYYGNLGIPIIGVSSNYDFLNHFSIVSKLFAVVLCKDLDCTLSILNLYGPYEGKEEFWS